MTNDIALMKIDFNGTAPTIGFARQKEAVKDCEVGGFGSPNFHAPLSEYFQVAQIEVVPIVNCIMKLGFIVIPSITGSVLCVGGGYKDTCQGDSGSGLICNGVLHGITSYGWVNDGFA